MSFTDIFIRRPVLALVVSLLILLIGLRAMLGLPIRQYPKLSNTTITVTTIYPGASPNLMQGFITTPLAQAIATAEGVDYLTSSSVQGTSTITAYIQLDFDPGQGADRGHGQGPAGQIPDPDRGRGPGHRQGDGPDHRGHVYRLFQQRAVERGDLGLSDPGRAAVARHRAGRRLGRHPRRPDLCDAAVARSGADGGARHLGERRGGSDPGQQLPVGAGPGEGLLHRHQCQRQHRADRCRPVREHGGQGQKRRRGADAGHRHGRPRGAELDLERDDERPARRVHRHPGDAVGQSADPRQGRARPVAGDPAQPAALGPDAGRLRFDQIHPGLDRRGQILARLGGRHRRRRDLPVPRQLPLGGDPDRDDPAVAGRRRDDHGGARVQPEPVDPAGDGAGDRARRRRCDRRRRKRLPSYRAGPHPGAGGVDRRARDRQPGHLDDPDPGRGLRADRLSRRGHRRAVPRIRLYPRRRGHHLGHRRGDLVADDVLAVAEPRDAARPLCAGDRPRLLAPCRMVRPPSRTLARLPAGDRAVRRRGAGRASSSCT